MPTPIAHAAIALLTESRAGEAGFMAGAVFPDIRYLGGVERAVSHTAPTDTSSAFLAGIACHLRVDAAWNPPFDEMIDYGPDGWTAINAYRLLVDELIYPLVSDWSVAVRDLRGAHAVPLPYPLPSETVERWMDIVRAYVQEPPNAETRRAFAAAINVNAERIALLEAMLERMRRDQDVLRKATAIATAMAGR